MFRHLLYILARPSMAISKAMSTGQLLAVNVTVGAFALQFLKGPLTDALGWMIIVSLFVIVDLAYGIRAAIIRKERVTPSNAIRRTLSKWLGYFFWSIACCVWAQKTGNNIYSEIGCGIAAGIEALSAVGNYLEIHGYAISVKGFLRMLGNKVNMQGLEDTVVPNEKTTRGCGSVDGENEQTPNN